MVEEEFLEIGKVVKPHGVKGKVAVVLYGDSAETLQLSPNIVIGKEERRKVKVVGASRHKKTYIMSLAGIDSFEDAQKLSGSEILIFKKYLPRLPEGEYYWFDLIGLRVETEKGRFVGKLSRIFSAAGNDVYVVRKEGREVLIPATHEVVRNVDLENGTMVIYPLEGLFDDGFL
ncbi:MAG: 16S rRNA processing protein RimM [Deltaproteobacteria bacterium]|nr:16S rRNA processing protein RimM [Deltaproteobacteria bacterium]